MKLAPLHEEFLTYLELERGCSPLTISAYRSDFRLFMRHIDSCDAEAVPASVTRPLVRQYIAWMRREGLRASSVARRLN